MNGIFLFDNLSSVYPDSAMEYGFEKSTWDVIIEECTSLYPLFELSAGTESTVIKFAKVLNSHSAKRQFYKLGDIDRPPKRTLRNAVRLQSS